MTRRMVMAGGAGACFATCRKPEDCARLDGEGLESFPLDYADPDSIATAVDRGAGATGRDGSTRCSTTAPLPCPARSRTCRGRRCGSSSRRTCSAVHDSRAADPGDAAQGRADRVNCSSVLGFAALQVARGLCGDEVRAGRADGRAAARDAGHARQGHPDRARADHQPDPGELDPAFRALDRLGGLAPGRAVPVDAAPKRLYKGTGPDRSSCRPRPCRRCLARALEARNPARGTLPP
jgi:hypothetical protein